MVQVVEAMPCSTCGTETDEACDWCLLRFNNVYPVCRAHAYTRSMWNGELHTLCWFHDAKIKYMRSAWIIDHGYRPAAAEWRQMQAADWESYFSV